MRKQRSELRKRKVLALLILTPFVSACVPVGNCSSITLREYDAAFNARFLSDTESVANGSALGRYIADQETLRDAVRACKAGK